MSSGWRAANIETLRYWQLRANGGWTGRANSALPLTDDVESLLSELSCVEGFYSRSGLPPRLQVPLPTCRGLDNKLARRGFAAENPTLVLTADIDDVLAVNGVPEAEVASIASGEWLAACEKLARPLGEFGRSLLVRHPRAGFAGIRDERGDLVAVGRVAVDGTWAGLSTAAVRPDHRRLGLATALVARRLGWAAREHGVRHA